MIDYHCHLDLYPNPLKIFDEVKSKEVDVLAVTTSPRAYIKTSQYFSDSEKVRVAVGFHPELVAQRQNEWTLFMQTMKKCKYIGEIGIDGSQRFRDSLDIQTTFFKEALAEADKEPGHIISIHSRGATNRVLSAIEYTKNNYKPVLHWFMGSLEEVERAIELGCWFSINPKMCESKQGQNIINRIPRNRILPETDAPFVMLKNLPYYPWDESVPKYIAEISNTSLDSVLAMFKDNLKNLEDKSEKV